ncbi:hypothetical protein JCGZ_15954 [Jatropha curcas]|uniref:Protein kinase domain-containing protein n=1 Tax=Jatropha curcas TaxID=180498 RepID=A0A067KZD8_JATCU|nr:hypothetical protein JCGZ_15954 [Jatropha curcas]
MGRRFRPKAKPELWHGRAVRHGGNGGSGTVYKIELSSGEVVAVKMLWIKGMKDSASEDQLLADKNWKPKPAGL